MHIYHLDDIPDDLKPYFKPVPQIGLEETPEAYVSKMVEVFREVRRVLRDDGNLWLNIGDSYAGGGRAGKNPEYQKHHKVFGKSGNPATYGMPMKAPDNLKPKDLVGIPWRVAFALQADGWWLRQDIIWEKGNPMPESCLDRCTKSHEYLFLLTKSSKYFFDADNIKEPSKYPNDNRKARQKLADYENQMSPDGQIRAVINPKGAKTYPFRNKRSVWHVNSKPFKGGPLCDVPHIASRTMH